MERFIEVAREAFAFLEQDYGFSLKDRSDADGGGYLIYMNMEKGLAIKLLYEYRDSFVFVFVYRLVDGEMRENVYPGDGEFEINYFDFNDALADDQMMKPTYEYGDDSPYFDEENGLRNYVTEFASRLKDYGGQLLTGDFSVLLRVREVIKQRARERG